MFFHEQLCDDAAQGGCEHGAHLSLLVAREDIDHAVHRFASVVGVEGSEYEQAGFGGCEGEGNGLQVAHFTDEDDVSIFAQGGFETGREGFGMFRNFALGDDAFLVAVNELDRLLDCHNVSREVGVNVVNQGRERGAFSRSSRTCHEHDAAAHVAEGFDDLRHAQVLEGFDFCGDDAEDRSVAVGLLEIVAAETVVLVHFIGEIEVAMFLKTLPALGRANFAEHVAHFLGGEGLLADRNDLAVAADFGRLAFREVEI